ncbi:MAG: methyltransferase domain-containing protein [Candidatus Aenigmatarchaeota archaeon]
MIKKEKLISEYLKGLTPKDVLDIGCGNGKISLMFIKRGANVTGIDKKKKPFTNKKFKFIRCGIGDFNFEKEYDVIIASLVLHFLNKSEANRIIKKIKGYTQTGGHNFIICFSKRDSSYKKGKFYPNLSELKKVYSDWKIIKHVQGFMPVGRHDNLAPHSHNIIFLLAKKVS